MAERWLYAWGLGSAAFGGASLLVPLYLVQLGATPVDLGILAATAAVIGAPGAIVFGRLADRVGHRRTLVLLTLGVVALALAAMPLLGDVRSVIAANAGLWFVVASVSPVLTMLVVADAPSEIWSERIGRVNTFQGYGWAGGLVLGSVWPLVTHRLLAPADVTRTLFWLLAGAAGVAVLLAARSLPRPPRRAHVTNERAVRRVARVMAATGSTVKGATFAFAPGRLYWTTREIDPRRLVQRLEPAMAVYLAAAGFFFTGFAAFWAPLPLFYTDVGFNAGQIFGLYLASSMASAVLYRRAGRIAAGSDLRRLQSAALALRGGLFPAVALAAGIGALAVEYGIAGLVLALIGGTWAVIAVVGTAIVTRLAPPAVRGEFLGVHTALAAVAGGIGGLLGGWIATFGYLAAFGVAGGLVLAGAALVATIPVLSGGGRTTDPPAEPTDAGTVPRPPVAEVEVEPTGQE